MKKMHTQVQQLRWNRTILKKKKQTGTTKTHVKMKQDNLKNPMTAKEI